MPIWYWLALHIWSLITTCYSLTEGRRNNRHNMISDTLYFIWHKQILARLTSDIGDKLSDFRETIGVWRPFRHYSIGLWRLHQQFTILLWHPYRNCTIGHWRQYRHYTIGLWRPFRHYTSDFGVHSYTIPSDFDVYIYTMPSAYGDNTDTKPSDFGVYIYTMLFHRNMATIPTLYHQTLVATIPVLNIELWRQYWHYTSDFGVHTETIQSI